ncbi:MAG: ribosomal protein [Verrucomicrobiota bacterium]|jgi:small subunit ribosomal protein S9
MATTTYTATGRRKTSIAQVRMTPGSGKILINGRPYDEYFTVVAQQSAVLRPLEIAQSRNLFDIAVNACGGGNSGQAGATSLGIARALLQVNAELRPSLKKDGLLTRDPRMKERKKPGQPGARKRFQFSKR